MELSKKEKKQYRMLDLLFFLMRQAYRLVFIFPYDLIMFAAETVENIIALFKSRHETVENCFLISSVIYSKENKPVSYNGIRTIFSPEMRAEQTKETIRSIHRMVPGAKAILIEAGKNGPLLGELQKEADQYIYAGDSFLVRMATDSKIKSLGESIMLLYALPKIHWQAKRYFKMSGRYYLNSAFKIGDWNDKDYTFKCFRNDYFCTRLYSFGSNAMVHWKYVLLKGLPLNLIDYPIENTLTKFIRSSRIKILPTIGLSGIGASSNENIND